MRILLDHGAPQGLVRQLVGHEVFTAYWQGWERLSNGELLRAAEDGFFDILLTTDKGIRYQQNLAGRRIAIVVLTGSTKWSEISRHIESIRDAVSSVGTGGYIEVEIPYPPMAGAGGV